LERESKFKKLLEREINSSPSRNNKKQSSVKKEIKKDLKLQDKRKKMLEKEWREDKSSFQNAYQKNDATTTLNLASHNNLTAQQTNQQTEVQDKKVVAKRLTDEQFQHIKESCGIASSLNESAQKQYPNEDIEKENIFMPSQDTHQQEKQKSSGVSKIDLSEISKLKAEMGIVEPEKYFAPTQNKSEQQSQDNVDPATNKLQDQNNKKDSNNSQDTQESDKVKTTSSNTKPVARLTDAELKEIKDFVQSTILPKQTNTNVKEKQPQTDVVTPSDNKEETPKTQIFPKQNKIPTFADFDFSFDESENDDAIDNQSRPEESQDNQNQANTLNSEQTAQNDNIETVEVQDTDHSHETPNTDFVPVTEPPKKSNIVTANMVNEDAPLEKPKINKVDKDTSSEIKEKKPEQERVALTGEAREKKLQELRTKFNTNQTEVKEDGDYKKSLDFSLNTSIKKFKVKPPKKFYAIIGIVLSAILVIGSIIGIVIATRPPAPIVLKRIKLSQGSITQVVGDTIDLNGIYIDYIYSDNTTKRLPATKNDIYATSDNISNTLKVNSYSSDSYLAFISYDDKGQTVGYAELIVNVYTYKLSSITSDLIVTSDNGTPVIDTNNILVYATYEVKNGNTIMPQYQFSKKINSYNIVLKDNNSTEITVSGNKYVLDTSKTYTLTISYSEGTGSSKVDVVSKKQLSYNSSSSAWEIQDVEL